MTFYKEDENYHNHLRESDDGYQYPLNKRSKYENLDKQINDIDYELEKIRPNQKFNIKIDRNELITKFNSNAQNEVNKNHPQIYEVQDKLYSLLMKEPIIKRHNFLKSLSNTINKKEMDTINLKLLDYSILKEIIDNCGSFPEKSRNYIWKYLLSLPCDKNLFEFYSSKGIHPFYKNLNLIFPVKEKKDFLRLQQICSIVTFWSPHIGNVYFLPNLILPFIKSIHGDDLFLFELLIAFFNTFCQYWFEFHPGAPLNHLKICERIIQKESPKLHSHLKKLETNFNTCSVKVEELIWRLLKNIFSETLCKENFLQLIDFILTYNHRPEILLYISCSLLMNLENVLLKCGSPDDIDDILFNGNNEGISNYTNFYVNNKNLNLNLMKIFKNSLKLYDRYSKFQIYKYKPYIPFPEGKYPSIDNFPLDFLGTTAKLREELFMEEENFKIKKIHIDEIEQKFVELSRREKMMQRCYESIIHKEKEKGVIMKRELDLIIYQKQKFYDELKNRKFDKINRLENLIDSSLKFYENMSSTEILTYQEGMRKKKELEEFELKQRLQQEELNNLEFDVNRKLLQLMNIRLKDEEDQKFKNFEESNQKEREMKKRLMEEKWKLEDEAMQGKMEYIRNMKEFEFMQKKDGNQYEKKHLQDKIREYEENLLIQEVERERMNRMIEQEYEENKLMKISMNKDAKGVEKNFKTPNEMTHSNYNQENNSANKVSKTPINHNNRKNNPNYINTNSNKQHKDDPKRLISISDEYNIDNNNNEDIQDNKTSKDLSYNKNNDSNNYDYPYPYHGKTTHNYLNNPNPYNNNRIPSNSTGSNDKNEFSSPNLSSDKVNSTQTNIRLINEGIRNITSSGSAPYNNYNSSNLSKFDANSTSKEGSLGMASIDDGNNNKYNEYVPPNKYHNQNDTYNDMLTSSYKSENDEYSDYKNYENKNPNNSIGNHKKYSQQNRKNNQLSSNTLYKGKDIASLDSLSLSESNS